MRLKNTYYLNGHLLEDNILYVCEHNADTLQEEIHHISLKWLHLISLSTAVHGETQMHLDGTENIFLDNLLIRNDADQTMKEQMTIFWYYQTKLLTKYNYGNYNGNQLSRIERVAIITKWMFL